MSPCSICRIGTLRPGRTTVTLERDGSIVLLKFVPAEICDNCGSYFLDSATTQNVLERAEKSLQNGSELEVLRLQAA